MPCVRAGQLLFSVFRIVLSHTMLPLVIPRVPTHLSSLPNFGEISRETFVVLRLWRFVAAGHFELWQA